MLFVFAAFLSCKTGSKTAATETGAMHPDSVFATLERSPCFGRCPSFNATIYNNGKAVYQGHSSVNKLGKWTGTVTTEQMKTLTAKAIEIRLDTLNDSYVNKYLVDFPGHGVSILMNGKLKKIEVMETEVPVSIHTFENLVEEILNQVDWKQAEAVKQE